MNCIKAKLFGNLCIFYNGKDIKFPYNKVEALFIYLLINQRATRNHLASLLWSEKSDEVARKNLRNALYVIKKNTNIDIFSSSNNSVIAFDSDVVIETDVDAFTHSEDNMDHYTGKFMKGFVIKDSEGFENWMLDTREDLQRIYQARVNDRLQKAKRNNDYEKVEYYSKIIIQEDEYNEEVYRSLIESYYYQGKFNQAIEAYDEIASKLYKELSVKPESETIKIYQDVQSKINERKVVENTENIFYGRYDEINFLKNNYLNFIRNEKGIKSIVIKGEMAIGKTRLKDKFKEMVQPQDVIILEVNCYEFEMENTLKPWIRIIFKLLDAIKIDKIDLSNMWLRIINSLVPKNNFTEETEKAVNCFGLLKPEVISELILNLINDMFSEKKIVMIFEDLQWMDATSLSILTSMSFDLSNKKFLFVLTCRDDYNHNVDKFLTITNQYEKVHILELSRFDLKEVGDFLRKAMPEYSFRKDNILKIYRETEGNPFFIHEYLSILKHNSTINIMTSKMKAILKSRFLGISEEAMNIVEICSIFDNEVSINILEEFMNESPLKIIKNLEELERKQILKELHGEQISFKFTHKKLREFIYMNLSGSKKKILHNKVGKIIERTFDHKKVDINTCYQLIYHFANAKNYCDLLKYKIKLLNAHLNFSHELFPVLEYSNDIYNQIYLNDKDTVKKLEEIDTLLDNLENERLTRKEYLELKAAYLHMIGRYRIRTGQYESGLQSIEQMMEISKELEDKNFYMHEGYKQMIYYCIQTNNSYDMRIYVNRGMELVLKCGDPHELAVFLRLKALFKKMIGRYSEAEKLLRESIYRLSINKSDKDQYALAIAAAYNYIGDIRKLKGSYSEALEHYKTAIKICEEKNILTSLAIFNVNAGEAAYNIHDLHRAKQYLNTALNIYKHFKFIWGKPIAESFMCLICFDENNYKNALKYLIRAEQDSKILSNPEEIGIVYKTKAEIRIRIKQDCSQRMFFKNFLNENLEFYINQAIGYFNLSKDTYQAHQLKELLNINE